MSCTANQLPCKTANETRLAAVSFVDALDSGELLTGTPTVTEVSTSDLTIDNEQTNTAAITVDGVSVAVGQAVQFTVAGGTVDTLYRIEVQCGTDATPAQTLECVVSLAVE